MKKKILLLCTALVTLASFAAVTGCVRHDDDYYFYGNVTFWNDDPTLSDIRVTVDGNQSALITTTAYPSYCNSTYHANFYLSEGTHYYTARTVRGYQLLDGSFYVDRDCQYVYVD